MSTTVSSNPPHLLASKLALWLVLGSACLTLAVSTRLGVTPPRAAPAHQGHDPPVRDVVTNADGSVIVTGVFSGTVDFDPGPGVDLHSSAGGFDVFVMRFLPDGSYAETRTMGGPGDDDPTTTRAP